MKSSGSIGPSLALVFLASCRVFSCTSSSRAIVWCRSNTAFEMTLAWVLTSSLAAASRTSSSVSLKRSLSVPGAGVSRQLVYDVDAVCNDIRYLH